MEENAKDLKEITAKNTGPKDISTVSDAEKMLLLGTKTLNLMV